LTIHGVHLLEIGGVLGVRYLCHDNAPRQMTLSYATTASEGILADKRPLVAAVILVDPATMPEWATNALIATVRFGDQSQAGELSDNGTMPTLAYLRQSQGMIGWDSLRPICFTGSMRKLSQLRDGNPSAAKRFSAVTKPI
jgi:hypothetical protein